MNTLSALFDLPLKNGHFLDREKKGSLDFSLPLPSYIVFVGIG